MHRTTGFSTKFTVHKKCSFICTVYKQPFCPFVSISNDIADLELVVSLISTTYDRHEWNSFMKVSDMNLINLNFFTFIIRTAWSFRDFKILPVSSHWNISALSYLPNYPWTVGWNNTITSIEAFMRNLCPVHVLIIQRPSNPDLWLNDLQQIWGLSLTTVDVCVLSSQVKKHLH